MDDGPVLANKNGMPASEELSANDSSLFAKVGMWIFVLAVLLVVSLILLNVLDVEGAIRFWLPATVLLAMSVFLWSHYFGHREFLIWFVQYFVVAL